MSLDLYIISKKPVKHKGTGIYIRENGQTKELSLEEANKLYPKANVEEVTSEDNIYWHGNITHNLGAMADHCLCYCPDKTSLHSILWRPEETTLLTISGKLTPSYVKALSICLEDLKEHRKYYEKFNPDNGWGNYDSLVNFTESFVNAVNKIPQDKYNEYIVEVNEALNAFDVKTYMEYNSLDKAFNKNNTDYDTLSTDDLKNELHNYVNTKLAGKVKSTDALNSFIDSLDEDNLRSIYNEAIKNQQDTQLVVNKLRQLARSKQNKKALATEHSNIDNAQKQSSMNVSGLFNNDSITPSEEAVPASYEGMITPDANTVFVFGSNPEGRHGAGAAKTAKEKFGAIHGQGEGLQGNSYALPTKDLRVKENNSYKSISPEQITESIKKMYEVARQHPDKQFKVAYTNGLNQATLNGYTGAEMIKMFKDAGPIPSNVVFSKNWTDHWNEVKSTKPIASITSIAPTTPKDYHSTAYRTHEIYRH